MPDVFVAVTDIHDWEQERWHTKNMDHWLWVTTCFEHYQEHIICTGGHHQSLPSSLLYLWDLKPLQAKPAVSTDDDRSTFWEWLSAVYQWCLGEILHVDENDSHAEESTWSIIYGCLKLTVLPSCCKHLFGLQTTKLSTGSMTTTTITDSTIRLQLQCLNFMGNLFYLVTRLILLLLDHGFRSLFHLGACVECCIVWLLSFVYI